METNWTTPHYSIACFKTTRPMTSPKHSSYEWWILRHNRLAKKARVTYVFPFMTSSLQKNCLNVSIGLFNTQFWKLNIKTKLHEQAVRQICSKRFSRHENTILPNIWPVNGLKYWTLATLTQCVIQQITIINHITTNIAMSKETKLANSKKNT